MDEQGTFRENNFERLREQLSDASGAAAEGAASSSGRAGHNSENGGRGGAGARGGRGGRGRCVCVLMTHHEVHLTDKRIMIA